MSRSRLQWYWRRLRAMGPGEVAGHVRKKLFQCADAVCERDWAGAPLESCGGFPKLPPRAAAPAELRAALQREVESILEGHWRAFGHLDLKVDDPPRWHCDYLAGQDLPTKASAFKLNHRALPGGADIKLIWELSRWHQIVRLAQAACVLGEERAARKCIAWLEDWIAHNPPYRGWNWTSALEAGMRLIQFTWMDALLEEGGTGAAPVSEPPNRPKTPEPPDRLNGFAENGGQRDARPTFLDELETLRYEILPAHVWFTWRHKSFGSSANNHLLGELAGLILATARWPALAKWGAPLAELQRRWEREVLAQFAEDGGNKEQALNYQLFAFESCWQARMALLAVGRKVSPEVEDRLGRAAGFFCDVQVEREPWDYGDSDSASVTPLFLSDKTAVHEWRAWLGDTAPSPALSYWIGQKPVVVRASALAGKGWSVFSQSGIAVQKRGEWVVRWDLSPLGYLRTAAHGHLDALHLSVWFKGVAFVIDPGTGCYYHDKDLRAWLASRAAHNGPCPAGMGFPRRLGPFLWSEHHEPPQWESFAVEEGGGLAGQLRLPSGMVQRRIRRIADQDGWEVIDQFECSAGGTGEFCVRWQFAAGTCVTRLGERRFELKRADAAIVMAVSEAWSEVALAEEKSQGWRASAAETEDRLAGVVSSAFRKTEWAPFLKLVARPGLKPCVFRTVFLASPRA